jgi:hypothetical protein
MTSPTDGDLLARYADDETDRCRTALSEGDDARGQIHATLAVAFSTMAAAEQARIANQIGVWQHGSAQYANDAWADIRVALLGLEPKDPPALTALDLIDGKH